MNIVPSLYCNIIAMFSQIWPTRMMTINFARRISIAVSHIYQQLISVHTDCWVNSDYLHCWGRNEIEFRFMNMDGWSPLSHFAHFWQLPILLNYMFAAVVHALSIKYILSPIYTPTIIIHNFDFPIIVTRLS